MILTLQRRGIAMIEVGIPFSDPLADGPVIQSAATQALKNGMTLKTLFSQLASIKDQVEIPLVLMGYLHPIQTEICPSIVLYRSPFAFHCFTLSGICNMHFGLMNPLSPHLMYWSLPIHLSV